jgi:hypothetical protein
MKNIIYRPSVQIVQSQVLAVNTSLQATKTQKSIINDLELIQQLLHRALPQRMSLLNRSISSRYVYYLTAAIAHVATVFKLHLITFE